MRPRLNSATLIAAIVLGITFPAWSQTPAVGGKWRMTIEFADEARSAGLEINVDGRKVSGPPDCVVRGGRRPDRRRDFRMARSPSRDQPPADRILACNWILAPR